MGRIGLRRGYKFTIADIGKIYRFKKNYKKKYPKGAIVTLVDIKKSGWLISLFILNQSGIEGIIFLPETANKLLEEVEPVTFYRKVKKK